VIHRIAKDYRTDNFRYSKCGIIYVSTIAGVSSIAAVSIISD
jgi:hypothetical protein